MLQIIRAPSGGWERDAAGNRGRQLWHNVRGRRTLTNYGRNLPALRNWEDVVVHIPVIERQMGPAAADRPFDARAKNTYYHISEETGCSECWLARWWYFVKYGGFPAWL